MCALAVQRCFPANVCSPSSRQFYQPEKDGNTYARMKGAYGGVLDPSGNDSVRVCVRIKPGNETEDGFKRCISAERDSILLDAKPAPKVFSFDRVADGDTSQVRWLPLQVFLT